MNLKQTVVFKFCLVLSMIFSPVLKATVSYNVSTIAGNGTASYTGDGGPATSATLSGPKGICLNDSNDIIFVDAGTQRVRKITAGTGNISTIAGNGAAGYNGDGIAATSASFNSPFAVATDSAGNIYVTDATNGRIRQISTNGIISTIAGTNSGYSGDVGAATAALMSNPGGVARDSSGNIYFADTVNNCIRMLITAAGTYFGSTRTANFIYTIAGTGTAGFSGDNAIATLAKLNAPSGIYVDSSRNVYIADTGNNCIRMLIGTASSYFGSSRTANFIYTIAGTGTSGFSDGTATTTAMFNNPKGVYVVGSTVYIADTANHLIRTLIGTTVSTIAGTNSGYSGDGGAATSALISNPGGICKDSAGNIYFADTANNCIRMFTAGGNISTLSGFTGAFALNGPKGICIDSSNNIYVADTGNNFIRKRTSTGTVSTLSAFFGLSAPQGVFVDSVSNIYVADTGNNFIRMLWGAATTSGTVNTRYTQGSVYTIASSASSGSNDPVTPIGIWAVGNTTPANIRVYFTDNQGIKYFNPASTSNASTLPSITKILTSSGGDNSIGIFGVANTPTDTVYYTHTTDYVKNFTWNYNSSTSGGPTIIAGTGTAGFSGDGGIATSALLNSPYGIYVDSTTMPPTFYVADSGNNHIRQFTVGGNISTIAGAVTASGYSGDGGAATSALLNSPSGLFVSGTTGYVADSGNNCIRSITIGGNISTVAGTGTAGYNGDGGAATSALLNNPCGIFFNGTTAYIADKGNNRIRRFTIGGSISTIVGTGTAGYNGDSIAATSAQLSSPFGVYVDSLGNVYVGDSGNNRIRKFSTVAGGTISTIAGASTASGYSGDGGLATSALLNNPNGIYVDSTTAPPTVYFADSVNNAIRKFQVGGNISTIAGGLSNLLSRLNVPRGVFLDSSKNIYIADTSTGFIRMIAGVTATVNGATYNAGSMYNIAGGFNLPTTVYVDNSGNIYVADSSNNFIRKFMLGGIISVIAGGGTNSAPYNSATYSGPSTSVVLSNPRGVWGDNLGNIYLSDQGKNVIRKLIVSYITYSVAPNSSQTISGTAPTAKINGGGTAVMPASNSIDNVEVDDGILQVSGSENVIFNATGGSAVVKVAGNTNTGAYTFTSAGEVQVDNEVIAVLDTPPAGSGTMDKTGPGSLRALSDLHNSTTPIKVSQGVMEVSGLGKLPTAPTAVKSGGILQLGTSNGTVIAGAVPGVADIATGAILSVPNNVSVPNNAFSNPIFHSGVTVKLGNGANIGQDMSVVS